MRRSFSCKKDDFFSMVLEMTHPSWDSRPSTPLCHHPVRRPAAPSRPPTAARRTEARVTEQETPKDATENPWNEVGEQLAALGQSIAGAFDAAIQSEENRARARELKERLDDAGSSIAAAGAKTAEQVRPHLVSALKTVNEELRKLTERMERAGEAKGATGEEDAGPDEG